MTEILDSPHLLLSLMAAGMAYIFFRSDPRSGSSRALALCVFAIALALMVGTLDRSVGQAASKSGALAIALLEVVAIYAGVEWGRRIGQTAAGRPRAVANVFFRIAQVLVLVYGGLFLGYILLFPELAVRPLTGLVAARGIEFAIFAPILGSAMLFAAIAIIILRVIRIDSAEKARLRALTGAAPFLLGGLIVGDEWVPLTLMLGLLIFLGGSVRYLMIQSKRGAFMQQFLSPEVAKLVQSKGLEQVLKRERRPISIVVCDLRGFTAFARSRDSDAVASMLEQFYDVVGEVAALHGGTVKDHAGDGVLILVGAPLAVDNFTERAIRLALDLRVRVRPLLESAAADLGLGIGIATGNTTVGAIRGAGRLEYVAVGNAVNLAARLCARAAAGEILCDQRTCEKLPAKFAVRVDERPPEPLKGFAEPIAVRALAQAVAT